MFDLISFIPRAVAQSIPLLLGSTGETITEKSGNLNLGIPGVMYVGGISGVIGAFLYEQNAATFNPLIGILIPTGAALLGSLIMGLLYCFLTVENEQCVPYLPAIYRQYRMVWQSVSFERISCIPRHRHCAHRILRP